MGPILDCSIQTTKLAYFINKNGENNAVYNEVHLYPARGENNLNGWTEVVNEEENIDASRTPEN